MYKKFSIFLIAALVFVLTLSLTPVLAKNDSGNGNEYPPEEEGTYDVPGHPGLKLRVHIYHPKPAKPTQDTSASLICSPDDPASAAVVGATGWRLPSGTWTYRLNTGSVPSTVGSANFSTIANNVFNSWEATEVSSVGNVNFVAESNTTTNRARFDWQNIISWGRTSGSALAVAYTVYYIDSRIVVDSDIILNARVPWSWSGNNNNNCAESNSYDAQNILTHEVGHPVGLNDMYTANYEHATLFGYGSKGEIKKDTLTAGDVAGVASIY